MDLKETAEDLLSREGHVKGEVFRTHAEYINYREGEEGVKKVEERMADLGAPVKLREKKSFKWEKEGLSSLVIVVAKDTFNWTEDDIFDMGSFSLKVSFFLKAVIHYFVSLESVIKKASESWDKQFDFGSLEVVDFSEKEKLIVIRTHDFEMHPLNCRFHAGYFKAIISLAVKSEKITVEETKCNHKGDEYHEYKVTWI